MALPFYLKTEEGFRWANIWPVPGETNPPCPPLQKGGSINRQPPSPPFLKGDLGGFVLAELMVTMLS